MNYLGQDRNGEGGRDREKWQERKGRNKQLKQGVECSSPLITAWFRWRSLNYPPTKEVESPQTVNVNTQDKIGHNLLHFACTSKVAGKLRGLNKQYDTILHQIIQLIVERCVGSISDETTTCPNTKIKKTWHCVVSWRLPYVSANTTFNVVSCLKSTPILFLFSFLIAHFGIIHLTPIKFM